MTVPPITIEKRPGPDWLITYQWSEIDPDEADMNGPQALMIFGAATEAEARRDALSSLDASGEAYTILAVERRAPK